MRLTLLAAVAMLPVLSAQQIKLPANLEKLASHAEESVNVTLEGPMLQLAARFMNDGDGHDSEVKKLVAGLDGIYVRSFEFASEGAYTAADLDSVRAQFPYPEWSRIVNVRSVDHDNADIYFKAGADGKLGGIAIIASEPREFTIVHIAGTLDPQRLAELGGEFGIPKLTRHGRVEKE